MANDRRIAHAVVFGSGRAQNGLLISPCELHQNDDEFLDDPEGQDASLAAAQALSMQNTQDNLQARLQAAAQPLDFSAPLEVRFASYDNYCSLFHFILNSEGPVELELPTVSVFFCLLLLV